MFCSPQIIWFPLDPLFPNSKPGYDEITTNFDSITPNSVLLHLCMAKWLKLCHLCFALPQVLDFQQTPNSKLYIMESLLILIVLPQTLFYAKYVWPNMHDPSIEITRFIFCPSASEEFDLQQAPSSKTVYDEIITNFENVTQSFVLCHLCMTQNFDQPQLAARSLMTPFLTLSFLPPTCSNHMALFTLTNDIMGPCHRSINRRILLGEPVSIGRNPWQIIFNSI